MQEPQIDWLSGVVPDEIKTTKKKLAKSDVDGLHYRLLLEKSWVDKHVIPFMTEAAIGTLLDGVGIWVSIRDEDTGDDFVVRFKKQQPNYIFMINWTNNFVTRRNLKEGQLVGIGLDYANVRFRFSAGIFRKQLSEGEVGQDALVLEAPQGLVSLVVLPSLKAWTKEEDIDWTKELNEGGGFSSILYVDDVLSDGRFTLIREDGVYKLNIHAWHDIVATRALRGGDVIAISWEERMYSFHLYTATDL